MKCPRCHFDNPETLKFCGECGTQLHTSMDIDPKITKTIRTAIKELTTGSTFAGRYQVIEEIGRGGMGRVYKVFDTDIKEKIALKLLRPEIALDKETIERFANELKLARKIGHRNVCRMFDLGRADGAHFITMEYVHGEDLKSMIRMSGTLSLGMLLSVGRQVADGLAEAHGLGVVHRDLKVAEGLDLPESCLLQFVLHWKLPPLLMEGLCYLPMDSIDQASRTAEEIGSLHLFPAERRWHGFLIGLIELSKKNEAKAIERLKEALSLEPHQWLPEASHGAFFMEALDRAYFQSGDLENARKNTRRSPGSRRAASCMEISTPGASTCRERSP